MSLPYASDAQKRYIVSLRQQIGKPITLESLTWTDTAEASQQIALYRRIVGLRELKHSHENLIDRMTDRTTGAESKLVVILQRNLKEIERQLGEAEREAEL